MLNRNYILILRYFVGISILFATQNLYAAAPDSAVFGAELKGTEFQGYASNSALCKFESYAGTGGDAGWQFLKAYFGTDEAEIFKAKISGIELQSYDPSANITSFTAGTDGDWHTLTANASGGTPTSQVIFRTKISNTGINTLDAGGNIFRLALETDGEYHYIVLGKGPLATEGVTWNCLCRNGTVHVSWTTGVNINTYKYIVDRRKNWDTTYVRVYEEVAVSSDASYIFIDSNVLPGETYWYRLTSIDKNKEDCYGEKMVRVSQGVPFSLTSIPNPGKNSFEINYSIPGILGKETKKVSLKIYNKAGRLVKTFIDGNENSGYYKTDWNCSDNNGKKIGCGIYFIKFETGKFKKEKKIIVVK